MTNKKVSNRFEKLLKNALTGAIALLQPLYFLRLFVQAVLDACFFSFVRSFYKPRRSQGEAIKHILVVKPDRIGDVILAFPFLRELKKTFPQAKVTLVVRDQVANLVENCPFVDEVLTYTNDRHWGFHFFRGMRKAFTFSRKYFSGRIYDLAIFPRWGIDYYYAGLLVFLSGAPRRIGYSNKVFIEKERANFGFDQLFTECLSGGKGKHEIECNLEIVRYLGGKPTSENVEFWFGENDLLNTEKIIEQGGMEPKGKFIAIGIGAKQKRKQWPIQRYSEIIKWLQKVFDADVLILGGPEDHADGDRLNQQNGKRVINLAGALSLRQTGAALSKCDFFIGNDSGPKHLAAICGCPTIEISWHPQEGDPEESNSPVRFSAWSANTEILRPKRQGPFCKRKCIAYFPHCICGIGVGEVKKAVLELAKIRGIQHKDNPEELKEPIPNFFIIGAPRSGTTSLSTYLRSHPNVFLSALKEPSFFDFDLAPKAKISRDDYLGLFMKADPKVNLAIGEASPTYLFSECAVSEILKFNPKAKFIAILRNPVDLIQSIHSHEVFWGEENIRDFEKAWRAEAERREGKNIPYSCREPKWLMYSQWGKFGDQIEKLYSHATKDKIKIIIFDEFVANPKATYEGLLTFLGVPSDGRNEFPKVNEGRNIRWIWPQQIYSLFVSMAWILRSKFGLAMKSYGISTKILSLNVDPLNKGFVSKDFREELNRFFYDDVMKLSKLLGRDLSYWVNAEQPKPSLKH